jgi:hypothetical protein
MAGETSKKSAKVAKESAAKRVAAKPEGFSRPDKLAFWPDERPTAVPQRDPTRPSD